MWAEIVSVSTSASAPEPLDAWARTNLGSATKSPTMTAAMIRKPRSAARPDQNAIRLTVAQPHEKSRSPRSVSPRKSVLAVFWSFWLVGFFCAAPLTSE